jgi:hypothetical protein
MSLVGPNQCKARCIRRLARIPFPCQSSLLRTRRICAGGTYSNIANVVADGPRKRGRGSGEGTAAMPPRQDDFAFSLLRKPVMYWKEGSGTLTLGTVTESIAGSTGRVR